MNTSTGYINKIKHETTTGPDGNIAMIFKLAFTFLANYNVIYAKPKFLRVLN